MQEVRKEAACKVEVRITAIGREFLPCIILYRNMTLKCGMFHENLIAYAQRT
jgi:hypothetical protein